MELWAAVYYNTDNYTYGFDTVIGIYDAREKADERNLKYAEKHGCDLRQFSSRPITLNEDWDDE